MRTNNNEGQWSIDQDEEVLKLIYTYDGAGKVTGTVAVDTNANIPIDLNAPYWEFIVTKGPNHYDNGQRVETGQWFRVEASGYPITLEALTTLYQKALGTKRPEWAAAYVTLKQKILTAFNNR